MQSSNGSESDQKYQLRPRLDYIAAPVIFGVSPNDRLSVYLGVTPHLTINNIIRVSYFEEGKNDNIKQKWDRTDNPVKESTIVAFVNGGISYIVTTDENPNLLIDLRYSYSLNSVYNDPSFDNTTYQFNETRLWNIELGIGVLINNNRY